MPAKMNDYYARQIFGQTSIVSARSKFEAPELTGNKAVLGYTIHLSYNMKSTGPTGSLTGLDLRYRATLQKRGTRWVIQELAGPS